MAKQESAQESAMVLNYLKIRYGKTVKKWDGQHQDDRQVFCNIYSRIVAAYEEMAKADIQSNTIWGGGFMLIAEKMKRPLKALCSVLIRRASNHEEWHTAGTDQGGKEGLHTPSEWS